MTMLVDHALVYPSLIGRALLLFFKDSVAELTADVMLSSKFKCSGVDASSIVLAKYIAYRFLSEPGTDLRDFAASILAKLGVGEWGELRRLSDYVGVVAAHTMAHALYAEAASRLSRAGVVPVYGSLRHQGRSFYYAGIVDLSGMNVVDELVDIERPGKSIASLLASSIEEHVEGFEAGGHIARVLRELGLSPDPHVVALLRGANGVHGCLDTCGDNVLLDGCRAGRLQPLLVSMCVLKLLLASIGVIRVDSMLMARSYTLRGLVLSAADEVEIVTTYTTADAVLDLDKLLHRGVRVRLVLDERCIYGSEAGRLQEVLRGLGRRYRRLFFYEYTTASHAKMIRVDDLRLDTSWNYSRIPRGLRVRFVDRPVKQSISPMYIPLWGIRSS